MEEPANIKGNNAPRQPMSSDPRAQLVRFGHASQIRVLKFLKCFKKVSNNCSKGLGMIV